MQKITDVAMEALNYFLCAGQRSLSSGLSPNGKRKRVDGDAPFLNSGRDRNASVDDEITADGTTAGDVNMDSLSPGNPAAEDDDGDDGDKNLDVRERISQPIPPCSIKEVVQFLVQIFRG